jgi:hypothetical protein
MLNDLAPEKNGSTYQVMTWRHGDVVVVGRHRLIPALGLKIVFNCVILILEGMNSMISYVSGISRSICHPLIGRYVDTPEIAFRNPPTPIGSYFTGSDAGVFDGIGLEGDGRVDGEDGECRGDGDGRNVGSLDGVTTGFSIGTATNLRTGFPISIFDPF